MDVKIGSIVCSKHFNEDSFDCSLWPAKRLRLSAVPHPTVKKYQSAWAAATNVPMDKGQTPIQVVASTSNTSAVMPELAKEMSSTASFEIQSSKSPTPCTKNLEIHSLGNSFNC